MSSSSDHTATDVCAEPVYGRVFADVAPMLRNFLYYKCGDAGLAADLVQEAFIKLWEKCRDVPPKAAKAFLFKVGGNLLINEAQKDKVRLNYQNRQMDRPEAAMDSESPEFQLEYKEYQQKVESAIGGLPEGQREVFLRNRIDKRTYGQIAQTLGVSVKAVEKRMHKALVKLRQIIHGL